MVPWRTAAVVAVFAVAAVVGGSAVRLRGIADEPAAVASLGLLAIAVAVVLGLGARSRPLSTPYW